VPRVRAGRARTWAGGRAFSVFLLILAVLLAVGPAMPAARVEAAGTLAATFRAHFFSDTSGSQAEYFDIVGCVGIINGYRGPGGPVGPSQPVTRAEFAVMLARLLSLAPDWNPPDPVDLDFVDAPAIPDWAVEAVATCRALDIIRGIPAAAGGMEFRPAETVSGAEAVAMLLRALENDCELSGGWPSGHIYRAFETGLLTPGVAPGDWRFIEPFTPLTRAQAAYLFHNALYSGREYTPEPGGEGSYGRGSIGEHLRGTALIVEVDREAGYMTSLEGRLLRLAAVVAAPGVGDAGDLVGRRVLFFTDPAGRVSYARPYEGEMVTGTLAGLVVSADRSRVEAVVFSPERILPVSPRAVVELNGERWPFDPVTVLPGAEVTVALAAEGGQAVYVSIVQENLPAAVVCRIEHGPDPSMPEGVTGRLTVRLGMGKGDMQVLVTPETEILLNAEPATFSELRERDIVYAVTQGGAPKKALRILAYRERVTGRVKRVSRRYSAEGACWLVTVSGLDGERRKLRFGPFSEHMAGLHLEGQLLTFCLDRFGDVAFFGPPGPLPGEMVTVKVLESVESSGHRLLSVDWMGETFTFDLPPGIQAPAADSLVRLEATGPVTIGRLEAVQRALYEAVVAEVDPESGRLGLTFRHLHWTLDVTRVPLYAVHHVEGSPFLPGTAPAVGSHLPLEAVEPGDRVWLTALGRSPDYILLPLGDGAPR